MRSRRAAARSTRRWRGYARCSGLMPIHDQGAARYSGCCVPAVRVAHGAPREAKRRGGRPLGIAGARSWPPSRPVLPEYAPSSCYGGSRAAEVASRGRGRPRRAQERRGRTRVAPRCGGDGSIRPVARTLRVGRRNHRRRASPVGQSRVGLSSQRRRHRQVLPDAARCPPRGRGSRPGRQVLPEGHQVAVRRAALVMRPPAGHLTSLAPGAAASGTRLVRGPTATPEERAGAR